MSGSEPRALSLTGAFPMSDVVFLLMIVALYAVSHGLIWALDRLARQP
jgi:hypothetical protein